VTLCLARKWAAILKGVRPNVLSFGSWIFPYLLAKYCHLSFSVLFVFLDCDYSLHLFLHFDISGSSSPVWWRRSWPWSHGRSRTVWVVTLGFGCQSGYGGWAHIHGMIQCMLCSGTPSSFCDSYSSAYTDICIEDKRGTN
jgi:hypothetical protein